VRVYARVLVPPNLYGTYMHKTRACLYIELLQGSEPARQAAVGKLQALYQYGQ